MILRSNLVEPYDFTLNYCRNVESRVVDYIKQMCRIFEDFVSFISGWGDAELVSLDNFLF